jgi:ankyrin repeat protein
MSLSKLPSELLIIIAYYIADSNGECRYGDLNSLVQANCRLYNSFNTILWQEALESEDKIRGIFLGLIVNDPKNLLRLGFFLELGVNIETPLRESINSFGLSFLATPLIVAAQENNVEMARLLLEKGAEVQNSSESSRITAMHEARSAEMVSLLLDHGANLEAEDCGGFRPLHTCTEREDIAAMRALLQGGAEVDPVSGRTERTPLDLAAMRSTDSMKLLLEFGADLKRDDGCPTTAWYLAAEAGKTEVLRLLMELWPEGLMAKTRSRDTPLHAAAEAGKSDAVRLLVELWPEGIMKNDSYLRDTPLHRAAAKGQTDVVRVLVERWPEGVRAKNCFGNTPLHSAAKEGRIDTVRLLVGRCPEGKEELNKVQKTPLLVFLHARICMIGQRRREEIVSLLGGARGL